MSAIARCNSVATEIRHLYVCEREKVSWRARQQRDNMSSQSEDRKTRDSRGRDSASAIDWLCRGQGISGRAAVIGRAKRASGSARIESSPRADVCPDRVCISLSFYCSSFDLQPRVCIHTGVFFRVTSRFTISGSRIYRCASRKSRVRIIREWLCVRKGRRASPDFLKWCFHPEREQVRRGTEVPAFQFPRKKTNWAKERLSVMRFGDEVCAGSKVCK